MPFDLSSQIAVYQMGREREGYPRQRDSVYKSGKQMKGGYCSVTGDKLVNQLQKEEAGQKDVLPLVTILIKIMKRMTTYNSPCELGQFWT